MDISQFEVGVTPETHFILDDSCVLSMRDDEDAPSVPTSNVTIDVAIVDIVSIDILGHVVGESDSVDPPLSFDILSGLF